MTDYVSLEKQGGNNVETASLDASRQTPIYRPPILFLRSLALILFDVLLAYGSMLGAVRWRYDFLNKPIPVNVDYRAALIAAVATFLVWVVMRQDRAIWRFTSLNDFRRLFIGVMIVTIIVPLAFFLFFNRAVHFPRSAPFISAGVFIGFIVSSRLLVLIILNGDFRALFHRRSGSSMNAILIGPANELHDYLKEKSRKKTGLAFNPLGLIETSGQYKGRSIRAIPVLGGTQDIERIYDDIAGRQEGAVQLISVDPNPSRKDTAKLIKVAANIGAPLARNTPEMGGKLSAFEAADLIGREMRRLDIAPVRQMIQGKNILITGAGGSIGSELSEQIMALSPSRLALVDSSEFNLYTLENVLAPHKDVQTEGRFETYIGDVTDAAHMAEIFDIERPDIVLHAAALKHVPLGEKNPIETLRTNVLGTQVTLDMCEAFDVRHFILISTDKAVDPANIMGASKRIVEMLTLARQALVPNMQAAAVRFGNVLSSRGSVVNLFEDQIARGGPVTVTHPDVDRYFMSVDEASALVLQAAALGASQTMNETHASSNIYVLEMGEPVNIGRLARQLIRLRGQVPDLDIEVRYTGLRPGEKLTERLTHNEENLVPTAIDGVQRFAGEIADPNSVMRRVKKLLTAIDHRDRKDIRKTLKALLPDYTPNGALDSKMK
ncbi:MAG: polysaccharide biosynthesis protein [Litorimonas sp.]